MKKNASIYQNIFGDIPVFYIRVPFSFAIHTEQLSRWLSTKSEAGLAQAVEEESKTWKIALGSESQLQKQNIFLVNSINDLSSESKKSLLYYPIDTHLTPRGNEIIAKSFSKVFNRFTNFFE